MTTKLAARYTAALTTLTARDKERGATALEYVGMLIVAAIVVGAIITVVRGVDIGTVVSDAVNQILGRG